MLDLLTLTSTQAQQRLEIGEITSVELVEAYLTQIEKHNHAGLNLNALISVAPRENALATARQLDAERKAGPTRGPLHGMPFVFKDVFTLHPALGMPTTGGAPCLASAKPRRTAPVIQRLIDAGMIVLGTANLTEFCGLKYDRLTPGFSPMGGQTQSPYVFGGLEKDESIIGHSSIGGSSAGSAAAVAAGFAPLSIGTECCGSLITPANRGACYALKCGLGTVDVRGVFHYTDVTDFIGGMAKCAEDLAPFIAALMQRSEPFDLTGGFKGLKVGFVNPDVWLLSKEYLKFPGDSRERMIESFHHARKRIGEAGAEVFEDIGLEAPGSRFKYKGKSMFYEISMYQMRNKNFPAFFDEFEEAEVHSVKDMIKWNVDHADVALPLIHPYQNQFYDLLHDRLTAEECDEAIRDFQRLGGELIAMLDQVDVVVSFSESSLVQYTSAAGCPNACAPLSTVKYSDSNERPFGLCFAAKPGREDLLLRVLAAFQDLYPDRPLPRPLLES